MSRVAIRAGDFLASVAFLCFLASAVSMLALWVKWLTLWMGWPGTILSVVTCPCAVGFPFVYRAVEGVFSPAYLLLWAVGVAGVAASMLWVSCFRGRLLMR